MGIKKIIGKHRRIMFDTAPIIYFIEENETLGYITDEIFKAIRDNNNYYAFSSVITLTEVLVQPMREKKTDIVEKYRSFLLNSNNFVIYSIDPIIAEKAAEIRATYKIKTPDAIQLATGIENNGTLFITNDENLKKVKGIEIMVLKDYI